MALDEARANAAAAAAKAIADADSSAEEAAALAELASTRGELEGAREALLEWETRMERMEQALADKVNRTHGFVTPWCSSLAHDRYLLRKTSLPFSEVTKASGKTSVSEALHGPCFC